METEIYKELSELIFPKDLLRYFTVVQIEKKPAQDKDRGSIVFHLDEKEELRSGKEGHEYQPNGFYKAATVRDFPLRDKKVTLQIRRRRWLDTKTFESISNTYDLVADGTRHSKEFAAFLKVCFGHIPDISFFA